MRALSARSFWFASVVSLAMLTGACRKTAEDQLREAQRATAEAEQKASEDKTSQTTITSADLGGADDDTHVKSDEAREAQDRAMREQAEAVTAARNEQLDYRGKLQGALDELDGKRREAKKRGASYVNAVDGRREVLKHHLDALDRTTESEWPVLKAKIDRDLKGDRDLEGR